jgi:hypothetical protein
MMLFNVWSGKEGACSPSYEVRARWPAAARQRPTAEIAIHSPCRQRTGGEQRGRAGMWLRSSASCCRRLPPPAREKGRTAARQRKASATVACFTSQLWSVAARAALAGNLANPASVTCHMSHDICHASRATPVTRHEKDGVYLKHGHSGTLSSAFPRRSSTSQLSPNAATLAPSRRR